MTEQPTDDSYPDSWKPRHIKEREQQLTEMEMFVSAMDDLAFEDLVKRTRGPS